MEQSDQRDVPLNDIQNHSDYLQKGVSFTGVDSVYILPNQQVRVLNGSITSEPTESPNNEQSVESPEGVNEHNNIMAIPAYVEGDDGTITLGFVVDYKSQHMNLLDENILQELYLYAEKLVDIIDGDFEFSQLISNKLLVPTESSPFKICDTSSRKIEHSVEGGTDSFNIGETLVMCAESPRNKQHRADSSLKESKSPKPKERHTQGTFKENILRKLKHGHSRWSKDSKELKVSAKWTLYKNEQGSKMKKPSFTMKGVATVDGQEVKSTVNFYLDDDVLINLMKICNSSK